jgi:hypothetical protein
MDVLMENIDKICTTQMGMIRIRKNLELEVKDVVDWCKNRIRQSKNIIMRGKNWYVDIGDSIITINKNSYTIITAHKKL